MGMFDEFTLEEGFKKVPPGCWHHDWQTKDLDRSLWRYIVQPDGRVVREQPASPVTYTIFSKEPKDPIKYNLHYNKHFKATIGIYCYGHASEIDADEADEERVTQLTLYIEQGYVREVNINALPDDDQNNDDGWVYLCPSNDT